MTNTTQNSVDIEAAKAAEELQAAKDKARALEAKAELAEAQRKEQAAAARYEFEQQRRDNFQRDYMQPLKDARTAFEQAVSTGGDTLQAWTTYMEAVHKAAAEESRFTNFFYNRELDHYEAVARQISEWNTELQHFNNTDYVRAPYDPGTELRGPWTAIVETIAAKVKRQTNKPVNRVQQINNELHALAKGLKRQLNRDLDSTEHILVADLIERPSSSVLIHTDRYEKRTYAQALQQAIDKHLQQVEQDHRAQVQQDIEAHRNTATK